MRGQEFSRSTLYEIMVVDDDPGALKLLSRILASRGYLVRTALNGHLALHSISDQLPDLVMLDIIMPQMGGFELCRRLKSDQRSHHIPIIFISSLDETAHKIEAFTAGGVDYITKPFESKEVLARVETHLKLRELNEYLEQTVDLRTAELTRTNQNLRHQIEQRRSTERALQKAHDGLERLVEKRTVELSMRNQQLTIEIEKHRATEKALRESEITYRTIFETTPSAMIIAERDATISLANTEFSVLTGQTKDQLEGKKKWTDFIVDEDLEMACKYHRMQRVSSQSSPINYECRSIGKDGQNLNLFVTVAMMPGTDKSVASFLDISELKRVEQDLRASEGRLRYLSSRLLAAQETERQRISMEIHDELGQNLALLKLQLSSLVGRLRKDQAQLKAEVHKMLMFTDNLIEEMRRISRDLSPSIVRDLKLCKTLKWMLHDFKEHTGIDISHRMIDIDAMFDSRDQILIYRIFQEALNNVRKHAHADRIDVTIGDSRKNIEICIEDNGIGFDLDEIQRRHVAEKGLGITSLEERTRMLGGDFRIKTAQDMGTRLSMTIPVKPQRGES